MEESLRIGWFCLDSKRIFGIENVVGQSRKKWRKRRRDGFAFVDGDGHSRPWRPLSTIKVRFSKEVAFFSPLTVMAVHAAAQGRVGKSGANPTRVN